MKGDKNEKNHFCPMPYISIGAFVDDYRIGKGK
jgi:hypothetical protein